MGTDRFMNSNGAKNGFTLVEMLIVIIIVGILAGIYLLSVSSSTQRASDTVAIAHTKTILRAMAIAEATAPLPTNTVLYAEKDYMSYLSDSEKKFVSAYIETIDQGLYSKSILYIRRKPATNVNDCWIFLPDETKIPRYEYKNGTLSCVTAAGSRDVKMYGTK